ncbi:MAG TPA: tyrosine-type recombinase/integrase [Planctomycetota bacterium]|jgi:integrase/recombinase XerD|nr:tyrosine-type recombinase/integrase [Planctomycetota bacterium]
MNASPHRTTPVSRKLFAARKNFAPHFRRAPVRPAAFEPVFQSFLAFVARAQGLSGSTLGVMRLHVGAFLEHLWRLGLGRLADLRIAHVDRFTRDYLIRFRRRYRATVLYAIRKFLRYLYSTAVTERPLETAMLGVRLFAHERLPRYLKSDEVTRLLKAIDRTTWAGRRDYAAVVLLLGTGLRAGEFVRLTLDDIDWRSRTLHVRRSKTGPPREIPIPEGAFRVLIDYLRRDRPQGHPGRALFFGYPHSGKPFPSAPPLSHNTLRIRIARYLRQAGLTLRSSVHGLRHTYAQHLAEQGIGYPDLQSLLGHATLRATGIYARINLKDLREVADNYAEDL